MLVGNIGTQFDLGKEDLLKLEWNIFHYINFLNYYLGRSRKIGSIQSTKAARKTWNAWPESSHGSWPKWQNFKFRAKASIPEVSFSWPKSACWHYSQIEPGGNTVHTFTLTQWHVYAIFCSNGPINTLCFYTSMRPETPCVSTFEYVPSTGLDFPSPNNVGAVPRHQ